MLLTSVDRDYKSTMQFNGFSLFISIFSVWRETISTNSERVSSFLTTPSSPLNGRQIIKNKISNNEEKKNVKARLITLCYDTWNVFQAGAATMHFNSTLNATRCTKTRELTGLLQSTDVCLTTPVWLSSTTTFYNTFPALYCRRGSRRGLD